MKYRSFRLIAGAAACFGLGALFAPLVAAGESVHPPADQAPARQQQGEAECRQRTLARSSADPGTEAGTAAGAAAGGLRQRPRGREHTQRAGELRPERSIQTASPDRAYRACLERRGYTVK